MTLLNYTLASCTVSLIILAIAALIIRLTDHQD